MQRVHSLQPVDYAPRTAFVQWYFENWAADPLFPAKVLSFPREEIFNTLNTDMWAEENPHAMRRHAAQTRFSLNVWAILQEITSLDITCYPFV